jgi:hypothetical protein
LCRGDGGGAEDGSSEEKEGFAVKGDHIEIEVSVSRRNVVSKKPIG